jgi:hypothetical protein
MASSALHVDREPAGLSDSAKATFAIQTDICPQILCRLLGLLAQQGRLVERVDARRRPEGLDVRIEIAGIAEHHAEIVAAKMRSLVSVRAVRLLTHA